MCHLGPNSGRYTVAIIVTFGFDSSREWTLIPAREREKLGLVMANDGEFWWICIYSIIFVV